MQIQLKIKDGENGKREDKKELLSLLSNSYTLQGKCNRTLA